MKLPRQMTHVATAIQMCRPHASCQRAPCEGPGWLTHSKAALQRQLITACKRFIRLPVCLLTAQLCLASAGAASWHHPRAPCHRAHPPLPP